MKPTREQTQAMAEIIKDSLESEYIWDKVQEIALESAEEDETLENYEGDMAELFDQAAKRVEVMVQTQKEKP